MGNVTKAQHYVWRNYLTEWADTKNSTDGRIFVYRKNPYGNQSKVGGAQLTSIAYEKFFYDVSKYTDNDINFLIALIRKIKERSFLKDINISIGDAFLNGEAQERDFIERAIMCENENLDNKWKFRKRLLNSDFSFYEDSNVQKVKNKIEQGLISALMGGGPPEVLYEEALNKLIEEALTSDDLKFDFNQFFWMQYFRSKSIHQKLDEYIECVKKENSEYSSLEKDFFTNMFSIYLSTSVAINVTQNFYSSLVILRNNTEVPLITGDTPIISLTGSKFTGMSIFYYPLSPHVAVQLLVYTKADGKTLDNNYRDITDAKIIMQYNHKMVENCYNEIYSNDETYLLTLEHENIE